MKSFIYLLLPLLIFSPLAILAEESNPTTPMNSADPFENYNRAMYNFNVGFNDLIGEPIANTYNKLPSPVTTGISNFFSNLGEPLNAINALLQGNPEVALSSLMRFTLNSTFGLFGLLDIATEAGLEHQREDLGQTLYKWGLWTDASFIMLPILGPYTTRSLFGNSIDTIANPVHSHIIAVDRRDEIKMVVGDRFVNYTKVVDLFDEIKRQPDPYIFMRESYLQHRINLIYNGNPPTSELDYFDFD